MVGGYGPFAPEMAQQQKAMAESINHAGGPAMARQSPVFMALGALQQMQNQVLGLLDELHHRLEQGGVLQNVPINTAQPSEMPNSSCPLVASLLERGIALEAMQIRLQTLLQQLAL